MLVCRECELGDLREDTVEGRGVRFVNELVGGAEAGGAERLGEDAEAGEGLRVGVLVWPALAVGVSWGTMAAFAIAIAMPDPARAPARPVAVDLRDGGVEGGLEPRRQESFLLGALLGVRLVAEGEKRVLEGV
jgi:hypothetical protein